jgi:lipid A disaccharide synthetase
MKPEDMQNEIARAVQAAIRDNTRKIDEADFFLFTFHHQFREDVAALIQLALAVYLDKPILILLPRSREDDLSRNLRRLARAVEVYDDTGSRAEVLQAIQQAMRRLVKNQDQEHP